MEQLLNFRLHDNPLAHTPTLIAKNVAHHLPIATPYEWIHDKQRGTGKTFLGYPLVDMPCFRNSTRVKSGRMAASKNLLMTSGREEAVVLVHVFIHAILVC